jgi:hypothetical protein
MDFLQGAAGRMANWKIDWDSPHYQKKGLLKLFKMLNDVNWHNNPE